ncbi:patatin-like phospholipase family protein [bacterium]|nr:patatin-like phospholipase family protein [bacterium]
MRLPYMISGILIMVCLAGCAGGRGAVQKGGQPPKVALVLGGGGARGFAHVGVIRELESAKIPIDLIVGVSVGSLLGALYADTADSFKLEWKAFQIQKKDIFDYKLFNLKDGLAKGDAIKIYIDNNIDAKYIENMKIPLAIVAVDINSGLPVIFKTGLVRDAVRASTAVPGIFMPMPYEGKFLVDGGVVGNLAPQVAKDLGADVIIGVNIAKPRSNLSRGMPNVLTAIMEAISIMGDEIVRLRKKDIDVLIEPRVGNIGITDFSKKRELIEAGRQAAKKAIPKIKQLLGL